MPKNYKSQTVTRENLCKTLSYKKTAHIMLMKLTPEVILIKYSIQTLYLKTLPPPKKPQNRLFKKYVFCKVQLFKSIAFYKYSFSKVRSILVETNTLRAINKFWNFEIEILISLFNNTHIFLITRVVRKCNFLKITFFKDL